MNRTVLFILLFLLAWIILGVFICKKYLCGASIAAPAAAAAVAPAVVAPDAICDDAWNIKDGSAFRTNANEHVTFKKGSFNHLAPSTAATKAMTETANYLKGKSDRGLTITGYYDRDEKYSGVMTNLGLHRANDVKKILTGMGVPAKQLATVGALHGASCKAHGAKTCFRQEAGVKGDAGTILRRGASFSFNAVAGGDDKLAAIKKRLLGKPITLYFATNSDDIGLNTQQRTDFTDLIYYLDNVPSAKLDVEGHTDNVGDPAYNVQLSNGRAKFARDYLVSNGSIPATRMNVNGLGPNKPVANNSTAEGKAKNRRVEVTLR